jgi:hypothetical protein
LGCRHSPEVGRPGPIGVGVRGAARIYDAATTRMFVRSREEVLALVRGLDVVAPGLVWTPNDARTR